MRCLLSLLLLTTSVAATAQQQQPDPDQLFSSAVAAQQKGDYAVAIRDYEKLLQLRPDMGDARANLGAALAHTGRLDEAIAQYEQALATAPDKNAVRMDLGLAYYKKNDFAKASTQFEEVRKARPRDVQVAILLGDSDVHLSKGKEAVDMMAPLEADNATNPDFEYVLGTALIQSGSPREGAEKLGKVAESTNSADAYLLAGSTLMELNEFEKSRADLEAALRLNPNLPRIYSLTGIARDRTGDPVAAEPAFREALRQNPDDFDANLYLGAILYKRRSVDEAKPYLDKALQLNPASSLALYEHAMWESTAGQYDNAAKELEAVIKTDPNWLDPHVELATVYYRLHRPQDGAKEREIVAKLTAQTQSKGPGVP
jgi:tetratricopeptide (TPR) repeat protein